MNANLELRRDKSALGCTIGHLYLNGKFFCHTLEDPVRPAGAVVPGDTAIAAGTYPVTLTMSPRLRMLTPRLGGRLEGRGVLLHPGVKATDTIGCILLGMAVQPNRMRLSRSVEAFEALMGQLLAFGRITLTIYPAA